MVTTCLLVTVSYEQFYINHFLYHYQMLEFDKIYLLIDKPINDGFPQNITIDKNITIPVKIFNLSKHMNNNFYIAQKNMYDDIIKSITEDWILVCDCDEYLYLHGLTIKEFLKNISNTIDQIQFPWLMSENISTGYDNLYDQLYNNSFYHNPHVKSIVRRSGLVELRCHSHDILKNRLTLYPTNNDFNLTTTPLEFYKDSNFTEFYLKNPFIIHFHSRGINNIIIKILCYNLKFKSDSEAKHNFIEYINTSNYEYLYKLKKFKLIIDHTKNKKIDSFKLNLSENPYKIDLEDEKEFTKNICMHYGINLDNFNHLITHPHIIYSIPENFSYSKYFENNLDLRKLESYIDAILHYYYFGRFEKRKYN